ncbi:g3361 [Coccomyxa viridis]|uniref:G3361 protein n=1 Tax=Coccomyxa viridis TaxID=1274662 RepID=A0ABP1FSZ1_9CHLO
MARSKVLSLLEKSANLHRAALLGPLRYPIKGHLYTTASKDLTQQLSLLFPASAGSWPFASAVVRELLSGGSKSADSGSSDGSARQEFTTQSAAEAEPVPADDEPVQNFRVLQLLSAAEQRLQANEVGPRVTPILQHLIPELRSLRPVELAAMCTALSSIGWQDSLVDLVLGVVSDMVQDNVASFTAPQLAAMCGAYVQLCRHSYNDSQLFDAIVEQVLRSFKDLDASGLVSLTNALSMADHESEKSAVLLKAIAAGALDLIPSFAPGQAVSLLSSFSCLRHYDEPLYRAVSRHLLAQGLQQLQPRQQANLLLSLARMGHTEEELVRQLRQQLVQDADKLRGSALCDVLWSLGILDDLPVATYTQLASLLEQQPLRDFQPSDFRRLYEVQRIVQACLPAEERGQVVLPGWMRAYASAAWQDRFFAEQNFTPLQQSVCRALADQGISFEEKQLHNMTFAVIVRGTQIALHPEGPDNYSSSWPKRPLGDTLAMRRMLRAQGWTVIPIPKHEWMAMTIPRRRAHVNKLVTEAST